MTPLAYKKVHSPLIIDPEADFIRGLAADPAAADIFPTIASSGAEALLALETADTPISAVFLNPSIRNPGWAEVLKKVIRVRPGVPIYLLADQDLKFPAADLQKLGIQEVIRKPVTYGGLLGRVTSRSVVFDARSALSKSKQYDDTSSGNVSQTGDHEFAAVRAADFLSGTNSLFDLYVRLASGRYLKILKSGDSFSRERLDAFLQKGITHFHMRKAVQEDYLAYCDHFAATLVGAQGERAAKIPLKLKTSQTANHGDQVMKYVKANGVTDAGVEYAKGFLENTRLLISTLPIENSETFRGFVQDVIQYEHAVAVTMLVSLLARARKIDSDRTSKALGLAAFLHDIGLYSSGIYATSNALQTEDVSGMNEEEMHIFTNHPRASAELLRNTGFADPMVLQMIEQHHERIDRSGFPRGLGLGQITEASEIVAICDEFASHLRRNEDQLAKGEAAASLVEKLSSRFSKKVIEAFMGTFVGKT